MLIRASMLATAAGVTFAAATISTPGLAADLGPLTKWERAQPNEAEEAKTMAGLLIDKMNKDKAQSGGTRVLRDAHPHSQGCVKAKFTVTTATNPAAQVGVFAVPGQTYDAVIRFSSSLGPTGDDVPDARGMSIKLLNVPGPKLLSGVAGLPDQADAMTQDFLHINFPVFPTRTAADFESLVRAQGEGHFERFVFPSLNPRSWRFLEVSILVASTHKLSSYSPDASLLSQRYFSMVPYSYGDPFVAGSRAFPIKFSSKPVACANGDLNTTPPPASKPGANYLRDELQQYLASGKHGCFDFMIQPNGTPSVAEIEDGTRLWEESDKPFAPVARIDIPPQQFTGEKDLEACDNLSFQPWHATVAHRPLGNINRARKVIYETISVYRHQQNGAMGQFPEPK